MCWYCYWGWPKQVADIYVKYAALVGDVALDFGPGHIVWSDENWEDGSIDFCINACGTEYDIVRRSLVELRAIPEAVRCCEPPGYEASGGDHPENFPPPEGLVMVRV